MLSVETKSSRLLILVLMVFFVSIACYYALGPAMNSEGPDFQEPSQSQESFSSAGRDDMYRAAEVIDGDTIKAERNGKEEKVRLIGIDTPEVYEKEECFGQEASQKAKQLLEGKEIKLVSDPAVPDKDKYGRLLRYVFLPEQQDSINAQLISQGYAFYYPYQPFEYMNDFALLEKQAREEKKGLWGSTCNYNRNY